MTSDIGNVLSLQPPAVQPSAAPAASQPSAPSGNQSPSNAQSTTQGASQNSQNQQGQTNSSAQTQSAQTNPAQTQTNNAANNAANNTATGSGDNTHFGQLLASKAQPNPAPASQTKPAMPAKSTGKNNSAAATNVTAVALLAQLQTPPAQSNPAGAQDSETDAVSAEGSNAGASSTNALLQQLGQLLQRALTATGTMKTAGQAPAPADGTTPAITTAAATPAADTTAQTGASTTQTNLKQALAQLIGLLQDSGLSASSETPAATSDTTQTAADVAPAAQNAVPDTAFIAQLAKTLEDKLNAGQTVSSTVTAAGAGNTVKAASAANITSNPVLPVATLQNQNTILQSAIAQIAGFLASAKGGKSDVSDINSIAAASLSGSNQASAGAIATPVSAIAGNQTPAANSEFVKLLSAASSNTPADQVLVQIRNQAASGTSQIKIQLEPADLGRVTVQMTTGTDGKTGVTITADNRQTLSMLQSEAHSLESALRNVGIKTNTGGLNFNLSGQQQNQQNAGKQSGGYTQVAATATDEDADYFSTAVSLYRFSAQQGLDIRV